MFNEMCVAVGLLAFGESLCESAGEYEMNGSAPRWAVVGYGRTD